MANFTITTEEVNNKPPYQTGVLYLNLQDSEEYIFTVDDFTINTIPVYADPEGDDLLKIKIISIPSANDGSLYYNGVLAVVGDEISVTDITNGLLTYVANYVIQIGTVDFQQVNTDTFNFDVADDGSNSYNNLLGTVNINIRSIDNLPPNVVGDGEETINHGETLVFTRDMFTTQTTPPYQDPEGDSAYLLKITVLPSKGVIYLNGIPIFENQIIPFSEIDSGSLTFEPDFNTTTVDLENFTFGIADEGSGEFTF